MRKLSYLFQNNEKNWECLISSTNFTKAANGFTNDDYQAYLKICDKKLFKIRLELLDKTQ